jgi:hypothetical protein
MKAALTRSPGFLLFIVRDWRMTQEMVLAAVVVLLLLLSFFWRPHSAILRWGVLIAAAFIGAYAVAYIPAVG